MEVDCVGFHLGKLNNNPLVDNLEKISELKSPITVTEIPSVAGIFSFFVDIIQVLDLPSAQLTCITMKDTWSNEHKTLNV